MKKIQTYTEYIKEQVENKFQEFLYTAIEKKFQGTDFDISKNREGDIYINEIDTDMYWISNNGFNIYNLEELIKDSDYDDENYKLLNKLLQEVIDDIKTNYKHIIDANKFDLL